MKLSDYFESADGRGIISTADANGHLTAAVYARPHFFDEKTIAFIMADRLTHKNLESNPHAVYLFMESGERYAGKRLHLTKTKEETETELLHSLRRKTHSDEEQETKFLVFFRIDKELPLIGSGDDE